MNLKRIAQLAGTSPATVSRVLNNHPDVRETTRKRVLDVIQQANYRPNAAARSLAAGQTRVLGLVVLRNAARLFSEPYFPMLILGISSACNARDHSVMLWLAEPEHERQTIGRLTRGGLIDGVVVSTMQVDDPLVTAIKNDGLPFILIGRSPHDAEISYVDVENYQGARAAVEHLWRQGRRRIATITGPLDIVSARDRHDGYQDTITERSGAVEPMLIAEGDYGEISGYYAMQQLLPQQPDAVFAANDGMALGALRAISQAGLRVPDDIALVGFDDVPFAAQCTPPLTTIRQPIEQAGAMAVEILIDLIENPGLAPKRIVLPTELVVRQSCGFRGPSAPLSAMDVDGERPRKE
jgi:LacI family transcriptional regulator